MPATAAPPPETATPKGVQIIEGAAPKPPPPPTTMIRASEMPASTDVTPRGPGKAFTKLQSDLRKKAGVTEPPTETPTAPATQTTSAPTTSPPTGATETGGTTAPETQTPPETTTQAKPATETTQPAAPTEKEKKNPWKVIDEYKARTTKLETEIGDLRKQLVPEQERKSFEERISTAEKRNKDLEDEIRYHNYAKSAEFYDQYQKPYEADFRRALQDLSEVTVRDRETGQERTLNGQDLTEFATMSFLQAKEIANRLYPDFAEDILAARRTLKSHLDRQQEALKEWREKGSKVEQERFEAMRRQSEETARQIKSGWDKTNAAMLEDPENGQFFKPKDGNEDWNQRLAKGFELVDRAYSETPSDPRLTPEQRAAVIKRHAAVRNRAAGWGALKSENAQLRAEIADLNKKLSGYQESTPPGGGSPPSTTTAAPAKASDQVLGALRKLAHV